MTATLTPETLVEADTQYEDLLAHILNTGAHKSDRTGTGTTSIFGAQLRYDLSKGFPLITTKRVHFKSIAVELLWLLRGGTNIKYLKDHGVSIWDEWADERGELGPVYGAQWRQWRHFDGLSSHYIDQIAQVVETLRSNPDSRRIIVSAWNVGEIDQMALPPCHAFFQFYVTPATNDGTPDSGLPTLSCHLYQRSADMFLGVPFNIASYALLTHLVALEVGMGVGDFIWSGGDCHVYDNHVEQVREQLVREPYPFPSIRIDTSSDTAVGPSILARTDDDPHYSFENFEVIGYQHHAAIKGTVAV